MTTVPAAGPLRVGITCFSTFGGSGVVASETALALAARGHSVHVFSDERPGRLGASNGRVHFHPVRLRAFPQLKDSPYALALTSKIVDVARRDGLDVVHAHYAIPHAISAYLARQVLIGGNVPPPAIVTTLHGTDITLVGNDLSFLPLTRFSILQSDAVTAPSVWLADATHRMLDVPRERTIEVIPNFVDAVHFAPAPPGDAGTPRRSDAPAVLIHVSNFRPLKRVDDVVAIFAEVRRRLPAAPPVLWLVGDGPDRERIRDRVRDLDLIPHVQFLGERVDLPGLLRDADLFLLPSESESFGLAALEAMSCGVPVVGSRVGGVPEVVTDGETGLLAPVGDVAAMTAHVVRLLGDDALRDRFGRAARQRAATVFPLAPTVAKYEALYRKVLAARRG
ncbi:MAG TPA: N-acetyl-alpha-D-glucosaminyl L-malate synthase BshA [Polyangia bacterium]|nr:N-acetyl-alpha-D-glucosaminyl L-malate synthase BshA [Polyangia bacterium]